MGAIERGAISFLLVCLNFCFQLKAQAALGAADLPLGANLDPSNNIVFTNGGDLGWIADPGQNRVIAFDTRNGSVIRTFENVRSPGQLSASPQGDIVVAVSVGTNSVTIINARTLERITRNFGVPAAFSFANNVAFNRDGSRAFVPDFTFDNVIVFNPRTGGFISSIALGEGSDPGRIAASPDGNFVAVVNTREGIRPLPPPDNIALIDTSSLVPQALPFGGDFTLFNNIVFSPDGNFAFVASFRSGALVRYDLRARSQRAVTVGSGPCTIALSPDGRTLAVANALSGSVSLLDAIDLRLISDTVLDPLRATLSEFSVPVFSPDGTRVFVASTFTGEVFVLSASSGRVLNRIAAGREPTHLALNPANEVVFAVNSSSENLTLIGLFALNFPLVREDGSVFTGLAIANPTLRSVLAAFVARGNDGSLLTSGKATNPRRLTLAANQQLAQLSEQVFSMSPPIEGWAQAYVSDKSVSGFFLIGDRGLNFLDGAVASTEPSGDLFFTRAIESYSFLGSRATTEIIVVNPQETEAKLEFTLFDATGSRVGAASRKVAGFGRLAESVKSLFADVLLPARGGYIELRADAAVVGLEVVRVNGSIFALAAQSRSAAAALYSAQFVSGNASGEKLFTELNLVNTSNLRLSVTVTLVGDDGQAMADPVRTQMGPRGQLIVRGGELFGFPDELEDAELHVGSLIVESNGAGLIGDVVFGDASQGRFVASLPLATRQFADAIFAHVAEGQAGGLTFFTGLAIFNPNLAGAQVTITVFDETGRAKGSANRILPPRGRLSQTLSELVPQAAGQVRGFVRVTSRSQALTGFELFGNAAPLRFLAAVPPQILR